MSKDIFTKKFTPIVLGASLLVFVSACGSDDNDDDTPPPQQEQADQGTYHAELMPINTNLVPSLSGTADFEINNANFNAKVTINGAPVTTHFQFIYTGGACPDSSADANADGFVDITEAIPQTGSPLVPLDSDLSSQTAGFPLFPTGANYNYDQTNSFNDMINDLRAADPVPTDSIVKLGPNDNLNLDGKVVVVHSISPLTSLPNTVGTVDNLPATTTIPIACGVISKTSSGGSTAGTTTGGTTTGGTTTGGTTTGGTTTGGTTTGGTTTGGTTTGGTTTGGTTTGGTTTGGTTTGGSTGVSTLGTI